MPIKVGARSAPEPVWTYWRREKSTSWTGIRTPDRPARSPVATPITLSRLVYFNFLHYGRNLFVGHHVWEENATSLLRVGSTVKMEVAYASETVLSTLNTTMCPKPEHHKMHHLQCGNLMTYTVS
jgi:hypothetical protein